MSGSSCSRVRQTSARGGATQQTTSKCNGWLLRQQAAVCFGVAGMWLVCLQMGSWRPRMKQGCSVSLLRRSMAQMLCIVRLRWQIYTHACCFRRWQRCLVGLDRPTIAQPTPASMCTLHPGVLVGRWAIACSGVHGAVLAWPHRTPLWSRE